jgi:hypothetical protein
LFYAKILSEKYKIYISVKNLGTPCPGALTEGTISKYKYNGKLGLGDRSDGGGGLRERAEGRDDRWRGRRWF